MSKLLFIYERDMPTVSILWDVFTHLKSYPEIESKFIFLSDVTPADIDSCDVIIFIRPDNGYSWKIAEKAREAGHVTVAFCDDDLLNLPKGNPSIPWRKRGIIKTLAHSDVIWSSSKYILNKYRDFTAGKRTAFADTIVRSEEMEGIDVEHTGDTVKIVYAAAPSHADLFERYIGPIVPRLTEEFGDNISFTFISVHPEIKGVPCEYLPGMPLLEYRNYMKVQQFDIGVAPLYDDEFSKCKYFNKFLEYTIRGVVGIYSNTEPYTYVIKNGINGLLAENNPESWFQAISKAVKEKQLRLDCVRNAIKYVRDSHSEKACIEKIRQGIPEIMEAKGEYKKCKEFVSQKYIYCLTRSLDWIYLLGFYLKHTGVKAVMKRIKTHYIESKAYSRKLKR